MKKENERPLIGASNGCRKEGYLRGSEVQMKNHIQPPPLSTNTEIFDNRLFTRKRLPVCYGSLSRCRNQQELISDIGGVSGIGGINRTLVTNPYNWLKMSSIGRVRSRRSSLVEWTQHMRLESVGILIANILKIYYTVSVQVKQVCQYLHANCGTPQNNQSIGNEKDESAEILGQLAEYIKIERDRGRERSEEKLVRTAKAMQRII
uniref:Uncharacterized protein n=1 Tax=Elaeophora elaphi TaxID=1147741 RepID=A0A0R3S608_9BILA